VESARLMRPPSPAGRRREGWAPAAVVLGAFLIRSGYWLRLDRPIHGADSETYLAFGRAIARGDFGELGRLPFYVLYPITLAPMYALSLPESHYIKWLHLCASTLTAFVLYRIGTLVVSRTFGLLAASVAAVYPFFLFWLPYILTETMFLLCLAVYTLTYLRVLDDQRRSTAAWYLLMCVVFAASRPSAVPCLVFSWLVLAAFFARRRWGGVKGLSVVAAAAAVLVAACAWAVASSETLRNRMLSMPTIGQTLWASTGYSTGNLSDLKRFEASDRAVHEMFRGRPEREQYAYKVREASQFIANHPFAYVRIAWRKMIAYWFPWAFTDSWSPAHRAIDAAISIALSLGFLLCFGKQAIEVWPRTALTVMAGSFVLLSAFGQIDPDGRYRLPAELLVLILALSGYSAWWRTRAGTLPGLLAVLCASFLIALSLVPFEHVQAIVDSLASDGHAESFTPALFDSVTRTLRVLSFLLFIAVPLLRVFPPRLADALLARRRATRDYIVELYRRARAGVRSERREHLALLGGIGFVGLMLRASALRQPVNYDEAFTFITYVNRPLWISLSDYSYPNNHLFHTALAHVSTRLFGIAPWALRLPAFVAGWLLIPLSYAVSRQLWDKTTALTAAALVATSEVLIAFSVCARGYTVIGACFLLMLIGASDISVDGDRRAWTPVVIIAALGFYTVPTFLYAYLVIATWLLMSAARNAAERRHRVGDVVRHTIAAAVLVLILYLPVLVVSGFGAAAAYSYGSSSSASVVQDAGRFLAAAWFDYARGLPRALAWVLVGAAALSALLVRPRSANTVLIAVAFWSLLATAAQRVVMPPRVWLFALPVFLTIAAAGLVFIATRTARLLDLGAVAAERIVLVAFIVPMCLYAYQSRPRQYTEVYGQDEIAMSRDVEQAALYLKDRLQANDAVVSVFPTVDLLEYYFRLHQVPVSWLKVRSPKTERHLVVTNDAIGQTLGEVLAQSGIRAASIRSTTLLARFEYNAIYEIYTAPSASTIAADTCAMCASVSSGYIGSERIRVAAASVTGKSPARYPRCAHASWRCTGTG
jgi:hypothetical protein